MAVPPSDQQPNAAMVCSYPQSLPTGIGKMTGRSTPAARLAQYRAAGGDLPVIFPMPVGSDWGYEQTIAALGC